MISTFSPLGAHNSSSLQTKRQRIQVGHEKSAIFGQ